MPSLTGRFHYRTFRDSGERFAVRFDFSPADIRRLAREAGFTGAPRHAEAFLLGLRDRAGRLYTLEQLIARWGKGGNRELMPWFYRVMQRDGHLVEPGTLPGLGSGLELRDLQAGALMKEYQNYARPDDDFFDKLGGVAPFIIAAAVTAGVAYSVSAAGAVGAGAGAAGAGEAAAAGAAEFTFAGGAAGGEVAGVSSFAGGASGAEVIGAAGGATLATGAGALPLAPAALPLGSLVTTALGGIQRLLGATGAVKRDPRTGEVLVLGVPAGDAGWSFGALAAVAVGAVLLFKVK